ncbi:hypothetical protein ACDX78_18105 [Virgibacillus oceani]
MKKLLQYFLILIACSLLFGCQTSANQEKDEQNGNENIIEGKDIFEFKHIDKAPEATEKHPIEEVIKVYFNDWSIDKLHEGVAIDIENNEYYVNPIISGRGFRADYNYQISGAEEVLKILEKYEVQSWKRDYTFEDPDSYQDGYSWSLRLQYENGSVSKHFGEGTSAAEITPDDFEPFVSELRNFVDEKMEKN